MTDVSNMERLAADAEKVPGTWVFGGETFKLTRRLDLRVQVALRRGEFDRALQMALGSEQLDRLMELDTDEALDEVALTRLMQAWAESAGSSVGESSASPTSSKSTARPSKPTSNGSTESL